MQLHCNNFQADDYISIRVGQAMMDSDNLGALLLGKSQLADMDTFRPYSSKVYMFKQVFFTRRAHQLYFVQQYFDKGQLPAYPDYISISDGSWQMVNRSRYRFFVFSAYFDQRRHQRSIRIIAATKTRGPERVWCRLWYKANDNSSTYNISMTVPAKLKVNIHQYKLKITV